MSDALAGTPAEPKEGSTAPNPPATQDDSGKDAQKWQEALKWKQKAEDYNKVEAELAAEKARNEELQRIAYGGGARQATDPRAALVAQLQEQAQYDPVAAATLLNMRESLEAKAEVWLANGLLRVPDHKREQVAALVRSQGYQLSPDEALKMVSDPETKTLAEQLAAMKVENERLKGARPNGISPSAAMPSSANADDGRAQETMPRAEYLAAVTRGSQKDASDDDREKARTLMRAVASNKTRLEG